MHANIIIVAVVFIYLLVMLGIGFFASRRIGSNEDFMVAGLPGLNA